MKLSTFQMFRNLSHADQKRLLRDVVDNMFDTSDPELLFQNQKLVFRMIERQLGSDTRQVVEDVGGA